MSVQRWKPGIILTILAACSGAGTTDKSVDSPVAAAPRGIDGAWRLVSLKPAEGALVTAPAGLYIFAPGHYSVVYATLSSRTPFANDTAPTTAEKVRAYDSFIANAGTYVMTGDTLVVRPIISRNPGYMGGGEDRFVLRFAGDTLWLVNIPGAFRWASGRSNAATLSDSLTLVRAR